MDMAELVSLLRSVAAVLGVPPAALAAALLASLLCGFVGTVVVLRRLVALGGGIAHAAFGGVGLALLLGFDPRLGAAGVAALAAAALAPLRSERLARLDAAIGVLWAVGMATGMLLLAGASHSIPVAFSGCGTRSVIGTTFGPRRFSGRFGLLDIRFLLRSVNAVQRRVGC